MLRRLVIVTALFITAAPAAAAPQAAPVTGTSVPAAEQVARAAMSGDMAQMQRLTGAHVSLRGKTARALRKTKAYRDVLLVTGPDFKLGEIPSGFEFVLRIPNQLVSGPLPDLVETTGTVAGWQDRAHEEGTPGRVAFRPIISVDFLK